jgi:hypothetical protein
LGICEASSESLKGSTKPGQLQTVEEIDEFVTSNTPAMLYFSRCPVDPTKINQEQHARLIRISGYFRT